MHVTLIVMMKFLAGASEQEAAAVPAGRVVWTAPVRTTFEAPARTTFEAPEAN